MSNILPLMIHIDWWQDDVNHQCQYAKHILLSILSLTCLNYFSLTPLNQEKLNYPERQHSSKQWKKFGKGKYQNQLSHGFSNTKSAKTKLKWTSSHMAMLDKSPSQVAPHFYMSQTSTHKCKGSSCTAQEIIDLQYILVEG